MDSSAAPRFTRVLLTGPPGIGKTTVCKKLVDLLTEAKHCVDGFYTEEVRSPDKNRIGFDIVSLRSNRHGRGAMARTAEHLAGRQVSKARVGNYHVFVSEFESLALPVFNSRSVIVPPGKEILIIDEIGKMELFSSKFRDQVENLFFVQPREKRRCVIATIPQREKVPQRYAAFFDRLRSDEACKVIEVDRQSRDNLPEGIVRMIKAALP